MPVNNMILDFSDMSGGKNSAWPAHSLPPNQVANTINAIHERKGLTRAPGYLGLPDNTSQSTFSASIGGMWEYTTSAGLQHLIAVSNGNVYSVDPSVETAPQYTQIGTMAGTGQAYAVNVAGKLWIVNGTSFVKVEENLSVYNVGLGNDCYGTATASHTGFLPVGDYDVYVSYARKVGAEYLYGYPYFIGTKTLDGSQKLTVAIANSTDPQVTHKIVWMTDAGGEVPYYWGEIANATASIVITNTANRNASIRMDIEAATNIPLSIDPTGIYVYDDKIFVWATNTLYWSLNNNTFDLERFVPENYRQCSVSISSVFSIDSDFYVNSLNNGIYRIPAGDMSANIKRVNRKNWFVNSIGEDGKTSVAFHKGIVFGLTNDGIRFFDGAGFSDDLSFYIKPDIDKAYSAIPTDLLPAITIYRRTGKRTELRFSTVDNDYNSSINNRQLVLNVDALFDSGLATRCWETWETGFSGYAIFDDAIFMYQNYAGRGNVVRENGASDNYVWNNNGDWLQAITPKTLYVLTRTVVDRLDAITIWGSVYSLATTQGAIDGNIIVFDNQNQRFPFQLLGSAVNPVVLPSDDPGLPLPIVLQGVYPRGTAYRMPINARGNSVAIEIMQTDDDIDFYLYNLQLPKAKEIINNLT